MSTLCAICSYGTPQVNGTGEGTTIYVVDSGIKLDHQEFKNDLGTRVRASYGGYTRTGLGTANVVGSYKGLQAVETVLLCCCVCWEMHLLT